MSGGADAAWMHGTFGRVPTSVLNRRDLAVGARTSEGRLSIPEASSVGTSEANA
jgi:hypothetical protein